MQHLKEAPHRLGAILLALFLSTTWALTALPAALAFNPEDGRTVEGAGAHVDAIYPTIEDNQLVVKSLTPEGEVDPSTILLHIPTTDSSHVSLPQGYEFLGEKGSEVWVSTEAQDPSVVWPGWSFEGIEQGVLKGTVSITYDSFSYAGEAESPRFAVTQPGGFDGNKVTPLIVPGTTFTGVSGEVGAHTHATWTFTDAGTYDIAMTVKATLADGTELSAPTSIRFVVGDLGETAAEPQPQQDPAPSNTIDELTAIPSKVDAEYFVGQTVALTALSPDAAETDTYRWYEQATGSEKAVQDPEQTTNEFSTKPIRSLDGTQVYVERITADGQVAETSDPITIGVQAKQPTTSLSVDADKDSYAVGDTAHFTSTQDPQTEDEHYHWYLKLPGEDEYEWIPESRLADQDLPITPEMDGAKITARLFNADHAILSESPVRTISVGQGADDAVTSIAVSRDKDSYAPGDTATFTADLPGGDASVEWSIRKQGENVYEPLSGSEATISPTVGDDWEGAEVRALVRDGETATAEGSSEILAVSGGSSADTSDAADSTDLSAGSPVGWIIGGVVLLAAAAVVVIVLMHRRSATKN